MDRRQDLKSSLIETGALYGAVALFVSLSFLFVHLDEFITVDRTASSLIDARTEPAAQYGAISR